MGRLLRADIILYLFLLVLGVGGFFVAIAWPHTGGLYSFMILAALGGLGVACYIFYSKRFKKTLVCPMGSNCNVVVTSKYSRFFGIPLEYFGFFYYLIIAASYLLLLLMPNLGATPLLTVVLLLTAGAFLFSLYLLFVQGFLLRQWCIWCLLSATLSIAIFIVSLTSIPFAQAFLSQVEHLLAFLQSVGFVIGAGGATVALFLFFVFLRSDRTIDERETKTLLRFSELVWFGLALTFAGVYASYAAHPESFAESGLLVVRLIALSVVFVTGAIFTVLFAPVIGLLPFYEHEREENGWAVALRRARAATLVTGGVNLSSWYFAFALYYISDIGLPKLLFAYLVVLLGAVLTALVLNRRVA